MDKEMSPISRALNGNHNCPQCGMTTEKYLNTSHKPHKQKFIKFICQNGHAWEQAVIETPAPAPSSL